MSRPSDLPATPHATPAAVLRSFVEQRPESPSGPPSPRRHRPWGQLRPRDPSATSDDAQEGPPMYRPTRLRTRAAFDDSGRLLALIADGESTEEDGTPLSFLDVEEGQAAPGRDQIAAALAELDRDALQEVIDAAIAEGQAIGASDDPITPEVLARINALADAREVAEERIEAIATEEQQAQEARDAALARLAPRSDSEPDGEGHGEGDGGGSGDGDGGGGGQQTEGQPAPQAVNASSGTPGRRRQTTALPRPGSVPSGGASARGRQSGQQRTEPSFAVPRATTALVAAAGNTRAGLEDGQQITSPELLGEAINQKRHALRNVSGGNGENVPVASLRTTFPPERMLGDDAAANTRLIDAPAQPEVLVASAAHAAAGGAIVAAGGLCAPLNID